MGQFSTTFTSDFDVSNVLSGVNKIQQALSKLKLPASLQKNLKDSFDGIDNEVSKIQTALNSGFKDQKDVTGLAKSFKQVETYINRILTKTMKISPNLIPEGWSFSASTEIQKLVDDLTEAREKVANFWTDLSKTPIDNKFADQFKTLGDAVIEFQNKAKDLKSSRKTSQLFKGLSSALESGDAEKIKTALDSITTKYTNFITKYKDTGGDWQVLSSLQSSFNAIKASLNEGNLKQLEEQVETIRSELTSLSEQDYSKLNTSLSQLVTYVSSGAKSSNDFAAEMHKTNAEMDQFQSRIKYFFGLNNTINLIKRSLTAAFNTVKDLDKAMTDTAVVTSYTVKDMWNRLPEYTKMANKLGATTLGAYQTATLYYQQGLNTNETMAVSEQTIKMARIGGLEYAEATDMMTAALRGFKMQIDEVSATRVNDVYSKLAAITAANTEEIATAMTKTASIADSANMSFETTSAFLSQIIETTREAPETAGTAMKTIIARFAEVKKLIGKGSLLGEDEEGSIIDVNKIDTALKTVGLSLNKFITGEEGLDDVLLRLAEKWDTLDLSTQRYIATQAAGSRQQSRFLAMMSDYDRTMELVDAANNSAGASEEQFGDTLDSLKNKLDSLSNAWNEFTMGIANSQFIKFGVDMLTMILNIVNRITGAFGSVGGAVAKVGLIIGGLSLGRTLLTASSAGFEMAKSGKGSFARGFSDNTAATKANRKDNLFGRVASQRMNHLLHTEKNQKGNPRYSLFDTSKVAKNLSEIDSEKFNKAKEAMYDEYAEKTAREAVENNPKINFNRSKGQRRSNFAKLSPEKQEAAIDEYNARASNDQKIKTTTALSTPKSVQGASTFEKTAAAITAVSVAMNLLNSAMQNNNSKTEKSKKVFQGLTSVSTGAVVAFQLFSTVMLAFSKTVTATMGWIGLALAVVAAVIVAIAAAYESAKERAKRLNKEVEDAKKNAEQAKKSYDELLQSTSSHKTLLDDLDKLTEATIEFRDKLLEANAAAYSLMEKYPDLAKGIVIDKNGLITFTEEVQKAAEDNHRKNIKASQRTQIVADLAKKQDDYKTQSSENKEKRSWLDTQVTGFLYFQGRQLNENGGFSMPEGYEETADSFAPTPETQSEVSRIIELMKEYGFADEERKEEILEDYKGTGKENVPYLVDEEEFISRANEFKELVLSEKQVEESLLQQQKDALLLYQQGAEERGLDPQDAKIVANMAANNPEQVDVNELIDTEKSLLPEDIDELKKSYIAEFGAIDLEATKDWGIEDYQAAIAKNIVAKQLAAEGSYFDEIYGQYNDFIDSLSNDKSIDGIKRKDALKNYQDLDTIEFNELFGTAENRPNEFGDSEFFLNFVKTWETELNNAANALSDTSLEYTDAMFTFVEGLSSNEMSAINASVMKFGQTFGKKSGTAIMEALINTSLGTDGLDADTFKNVDFSNTISAIYDISKINTKKLSEDGKKQLNEIITGMSGDVSDSDLLSDLLTSDQFTEISDQVQGFIDSTGEISASNIYELADSCSLVSEYLEISGDDAGVLAAILESIYLDGSSVEDFTDNILAALRASEALSSVNAKAFNFIDNKWARSQSEIGDYWVESAETLKKEMSEGYIQSDTTNDIFGAMFGEERLQEYKDKLYEYAEQGLSSAEIGEKISQDFAKEIETINALIEGGDLQPLYDYFADQLPDSEDNPFKILEDGTVEFNDSIKTTQDAIDALMGALGISEELAANMLSDIVAKSPNLGVILGQGDAEKAYNDFMLSAIETGKYTTGELQTMWSLYGSSMKKMFGTDKDGNYIVNNLEDFIAKITNDINDKTKKNKNKKPQLFDLENNWAADGKGYQNLRAGVGGTNLRESNQKINDYLAPTLKELEEGGSSHDVDEIIGKFEELGASTQDAAQTGWDWAKANEKAMHESVTVWKDGKAKIEPYQYDMTKTLKENQAAAAAYFDDLASKNNADNIAKAIGEQLTGVTDLDINVNITKTGDAELDAAYGGWVDKTVKITFKGSQEGEWPSGEGGEGDEADQHAQRAAGTAQAYGNAFLNGMWGTGADKQTALTGELGQEIVVDPHSGRWHTVGDNGAEFTKLPKDAIVFNHLQTKGLLQNRRIFGRGKALASGNAYAGKGYGINIDFGDTEPSKKNGSKSKSKDWENELDPQYNTLKRIEKIERDREKLEEELERIYEKGAALDNLRQQEAILDEIIDKQTKLIDMRKQELEELMKENEEWKDYAYFDPQLGQLIIDWEKIDALKGDKGEEFDEYFDDLEEYYDRLVDAEDGQTDAINDLYDLIDDQRDQYLSIEEKVMDAVLTEVQQVIDRLSGINEAINDSNAKLIESMQKSIDDERRLRENEDTEKEIADKQARLDLLSRDTSGTYATEIKELTKEIADMQEDYTDTLVDQAIQNLQDQYDLAADERERNIELLQNQKDFKEENGKYWDLALKMLSGNEADLEAYLMMYDEEYKKASPEDQLKMLEEMKNEYATGMAWYYEHGQNNIGKNEDGSINGYTGEGDADKEKAGKQTYKEEITGETKFEKENDKSVEYKKVNKTIITQYYNPDGTEGLVEEELKEEWVPTGNVYDPKPGGGSKLVTSGNNGDYYYNGNGPMTLAEVLKAANLKNGVNGKTSNLTMGEVNGYLVANRVNVNNSSSGATAEVPVVSKTEEDKKITVLVKKPPNVPMGVWKAERMATGGLADYTGPAWLDGSLSKPELVLNPNETQDFLEFIKIFRSLGNIEMPSQNNGENHFDIHIEIDSMGSDYDVDQMVDRVVHKIGEKASYRNVNVITNFRR